VDVLEHEVKKIVRMVRAFPVLRFDERHDDCGQSARQLGEGFVDRVRRIEEITFGRTAPAAPPRPRSRGSLLLELETAFLGASEALLALPASRWGEIVTAPAGLTGWHQARRGELLWLALRELVRHDRHFGIHLRAARENDGDSVLRERDDATGPVLALGA
jgi:hypothetical protein